MICGTEFGHVMAALMWWTYI